MAVPEHSLTQFLQHPGQIFPELDRGEVVLRRRDGEDLVLVTLRQMEALRSTLRALVAVQESGGDVGRASSVLPWLEFLSEADRRSCLAELQSVATAATSTGQLGRLEETLAEWEATGLGAWDERRLRERDDYAEYLVEDATDLPRPGG